MGIEAQVEERGAALPRDLGLRLKARALSGFLMTLLFVVLAIVPIVQVESRLMFGMKLSALILITNAVGVAIFSSISAN